MLVPGPATLPEMLLSSAGQAIRCHQRQCTRVFGHRREHRIACQQIPYALIVLIGAEGKRRGAAAARQRWQPECGRLSRFAVM